jgi:hypothetical protein
MTENLKVSMVVFSPMWNRVGDLHLEQMEINACQWEINVERAENEVVITAKKRKIFLLLCANSLIHVNIA